ncbi:MAG: nucleotidyltransferase family protein, partial [bacterium]|nr:nucleotidyltransferase family protein [bacterium]
MSKEVLNIICIGIEDTIHTAIQRINQSGKGIALVTTADRKLIGTVTDGDIRRAILDAIPLSNPVSIILERKKGTRYEVPLKASIHLPIAEQIELMHQHHISQLPLLDDDGTVIDLVTLSEVAPVSPTPLRAVIMAGGFGTRLRPYTETTPKPMLPVGDKPLMEHIIEQLKNSGIHHVNITTHYLPEKIMAYFRDGSDFGVKVDYVQEDSPLGTAGALSLMEAPTEPLLVMNGDVLTQVDFRAMYRFHQEHKAYLTVGVRQYDIQVPFGVIETKEMKVVSITEKPTLSFFVNAGIYILEPAVHQYIPKSQKFDMTDLMKILIEEKKDVVSFPIVEYWLDIGNPKDYETA